MSRPSWGELLSPTPGSLGEVVSQGLPVWLQLDVELARSPMPIWKWCSVFRARQPGRAVGNPPEAVAP